MFFVVVAVVAGAFCVVDWLRAGCPRNRLIAARSKKLTGCGTYTTPYPAAVKWPRRETDHWPSNGEVDTERTCVSTSTLFLHVVLRDSITLRYFSLCRDASIWTRQVLSKR